MSVKATQSLVESTLAFMNRLLAARYDSIILAPPPDAWRLQRANPLTDRGSTHPSVSSSVREWRLRSCTGNVRACSSSFAECVRRDAENRGEPRKARGPLIMCCYIAKRGMVFKSQGLETNMVAHLGFTIMVSCNAMVFLYFWRFPTPSWPVSAPVVIIIRIFRRKKTATEVRKAIGSLKVRT